MKWCQLDHQVALTEASQPVREKIILSVNSKLLIWNYQKLQKNYNYEVTHHWCWVPNDIPSFWLVNTAVYRIYILHTYCCIHSYMCTILMLLAIIHCQTVHKRAKYNLSALVISRCLSTCIVSDINAYQCMNQYCWGFVVKCDIIFGTKDLYLNVVMAKCATWPKLLWNQLVKNSPFFIF